MGARRDAGGLIRLFATLSLVATAGCALGARRQPCADPTKDGACFCPDGASCEHACSPAVGHCMLGCSERNASCGVTCGDDCVALCSGAGDCEAHCGERCNVSCEGVRERCVAVVGASSNVRCEGANDCRVECKGSCTVNCSGGRCRVRCAELQSCDIECDLAAGRAGGGLMSCPDGTSVCGQVC